MPSVSPGHSGLSGPGTRQTVIGTGGSPGITSMASAATSADRSNGSLPSGSATAGTDGTGWCRCGDLFMGGWAPAPDGRIHTHPWPNWAPPRSDRRELATQLAPNPSRTPTQPAPGWQRRPTQLGPAPPPNQESARCRYRTLGDRRRGWVHVRHGGAWCSRRRTRSGTCADLPSGLGAPLPRRSPTAAACRWRTSRTNSRGAGHMCHDRRYAPRPFDRYRLSSGHRYPVPATRHRARARTGTGRPVPVSGTTGTASGTVPLYRYRSVVPVPLGRTGTARSYRYRSVVLVPAVARSVPVTGNGDSPTERESASPVPVRGHCPPVPVRRVPGVVPQSFGRPGVQVPHPAGAEHPVTHGDGGWI